MFRCKMGPFLIVLPLLVVSVSSSSLSDREGTNALPGLNNKLATDIHKKLSKEDENVFFSPLSISTAMGMLFYGTRGRTAEEMRRALGYQNAGLTNDNVHSAFQKLLDDFSEDSATKEYLLYVANAVMTKKGYPILPEYKNGLQNIYKANAREVDFEKEGPKAVQEINDWVKLKTNNQIQKLLADLDPATVMVLLNAVYFKGTWKTKFEHSKEGIFFNRGLKSELAKVPMMYLEDEVRHARIGDARAIELPYKGEDVSMVIVLPDKLDGLSSVEQELTADTLKDITKNSGKAELMISMPKFKLEYEKNLNDVLQDLGIKDVFQSSADLSGISKKEQLTVSDVVHKAVIEVNEEGSEASGITGVVVVPLSILLDKEFIVNHPFLFAIVDRRSDTILFQGRVNKL